MGMFIFSIKYSGNPKKPVLPLGTKLNWHVYGNTLPFDYIDLSKLAAQDGMYHFFDNSAYTSLPELSDTSRFIVWASAFYGCYLLAEIPSIDTSGGNDFVRMFSGCAALTTIPRLNISGATSSNRLTDIFAGCTNLAYIGWEGSINEDLSIADSAQLSDATILATAYILSDGLAKTLTLNSALSAKATQNIKLNATADGLEFCDASDPDTIGTLNDYVTAKSWTLQFS